MRVNRQKLTPALDKLAEGRRVCYGLNALMALGVTVGASTPEDSIAADASFLGG